MSNPEQQSNWPENMPMKPMGGREAVPSLSDQEYKRLCELVDRFVDFKGEDDPEYQEWLGLQRRADKDILGS
jgi:hypothetical protein